MVMCMYFFVHAFVCDAFMFRLAPTIHCILTSYFYTIDVLRPLYRINVITIHRYHWLTYVFMDSVFHDRDYSYPMSWESEVTV